MASLPSITGGVTSGGVAPAAGGYIQPTLGHGFRIWWALYWRTSLIAIGLVYFVALWVGILARNDLLSVQAGALINKATPYVFTFAAAFFIMHRVVRKQFRQFRISLTPAGSAELGHELPATRERTTRIWWTYTWRSIIYLVIATLVAYVPMSFVLLVAAAVSPLFARIAGLLVGLVLNGAVGLFVIYSNILDEDIGGFRVGLVTAETSQPLAPPGSSAS